MKSYYFYGATVITTIFVCWKYYELRKGIFLHGLSTRLDSLDHRKTLERLDFKQSGMDDLNREVIRLQVANRTNVGIRFTMCKVCLEFYHESTRPVCALIPCGHSVCVKCSRRISTKCPICQAVYNQTVVLYNN